VFELLDSRLITKFIAFLEEKNFIRPAANLGYFQSTITTHIQHLQQLCKKILPSIIERS
jgi:DNA-binding transcriptional LysR family regulator